MMPLADPNDAFDRQAHASYREAADALSPTMQGRLRAARRTTLAGTTARPASSRRWAWQALPVAAVAMALFAVAIGQRWQASHRTDPVSADMSAAPVSVLPAPANDGEPVAPANQHLPATTVAAVQPEIDTSLLVLDEDPDFYMWLGSEVATPADAEPRHDPT